MLVYKKKVNNFYNKLHILEFLLLTLEYDKIF